MRRLVVLAAATAAGCGGGSGGVKPPADPNIKIEESSKTGLGPAERDRVRKYEGPVSQAPDWAKPAGK